MFYLDTVRNIKIKTKNIILKQGGFYVHHHILQEHLAPDGVHLTPIGNNLIINAFASNLAQAIRIIVLKLPMSVELLPYD